MGQGPNRGPLKNMQTTTGNGVLLVYAGNITGYMNLEVGYHVEMDSLVGLRCDIVLERGDNVLSHTGIFYKFSSPNHTVYYDFLSHQSTISGNSGAQGGDPGLVALGTEKVDGYTCTHVQYKDKTSVQNYWMSTQVPGFQSLMNVLRGINSILPGMATSGTIFAWGGLVKLDRTDTEEDGKTTTAHIHLVEANPNISFPTKDFDVP